MSFDSLCTQSSLVLCPLLNVREPTCFARNIDLNTFLLFQPSVLVIHLVALIMTAIMIFNVKSKYTAVGRKEMVLFFYLYAVVTVLEFLTISGIIPLSSSLYAYFASLHTAFIVSLFFTLAFNGFVPFQIVEDGTRTSLWTLRISTGVIGIIVFIISLTTVKNAGLSTGNPVLLFVCYAVLPLLFTITYLISQIYLVTNTLETSWHLVDITFATIFFILGILSITTFSTSFCTLVKHYLDGIFLSTIFNLLAVMMVYKYWDGITKEDLEFAVGIKQNTWDIRDPLLSDDAIARMSGASLE